MPIFLDWRKTILEIEEHADMKEDVEQSEKLQEIIDLLVAAGYFRARIKNVSPFDKVVGGMTWCIEFCNIEVDVDFLYQENLTIGQKIALTEKIVAVLPKIQCPHPIEPHQIQGLDFIHIFPVMQWLVKRSMEFREDVSNFCYSYALNQFEKNFSLYHGLTGKQQQLLKNLKVVQDSYKPHRVFKRKNIVPFKDINSKVQITLLEYGHKMVSPKIANTEKSTNYHMEEKEIDKIMDNMDVMQEETFEYNEEEREKISEHFENLKKEFEVSTSPSNSEYHIEHLIEKKKDAINSLEKSILHQTKLRRDIETMRESISQLKLAQRDVEEAIKHLKFDEIDSEKSKEVERLLLDGDNLEKQKLDFEEHCTKESHRLKDLNEWQQLLGQLTGTCRRELTKMSIDLMNDEKDMLLVKIPDSKIHIERTLLTMVETPLTFVLEYCLFVQNKPYLPDVNYYSSNFVK